MKCIIKPVLSITFLCTVRGTCAFAGRVHEQSIGPVNGKLVPQHSSSSLRHNQFISECSVRASFHMQSSNSSESGGASNMKCAHLTDKEFETQRIRCFRQHNLVSYTMNSKTNAPKATPNKRHRYNVTKIQRYKDSSSRWLEAQETHIQCCLLH